MNYKDRLDPRTVTAALKRGGFTKGGTVKTRVGQWPIYGFVSTAEKEYIYREGNPGLGIIGDRKTGAVIVDHGADGTDPRSTRENRAERLAAYADYLTSEGFDVERGTLLRVRRRSEK